MRNALPVILLAAQSKNLGAALQTLLTKVKSGLRRRKLLEQERSMGVERLSLLTLSLLSNFKYPHKTCFFKYSECALCLYFIINNFNPRMGN